MSLGRLSLKPTRISICVVHLCIFCKCHGQVKNAGRVKTATTKDKVLLTVAIYGEGCVGGGDLVVADLAVLRRTVLVGGLHLQDAVVNLLLCHRGVVLGLPKHRGKLVHIVHLDVHHCPADTRF